MDELPVLVVSDETVDVTDELVGHPLGDNPKPVGHSSRSSITPSPSASF